MKPKALAILLLTCCLAVGLVFLTYHFEKSGNISKIRNQFAHYGLTVTEVKTTKNETCFYFESLNSSLTEEDILLLRYILETAEGLKFDPSWEIVLENKDRMKLCQIRFSEFAETGTALQFKSMPSNKDPNLLAFEIKSDFAKENYSCAGIKVTSYPQIYIKNNLPQRKEISVNIRITTSLTDENSFAEIDKAVKQSVKNQNADGGGIAQYNLSITDTEGKILYLSSTDFLRNNILRLI